MSALTRWVLAHKRIVTLFWIALTVIGIASANSATKALDQKFSVPGKEGWETNVAIAEHFHGTGGDTAPIVPVVTLPAGRDRRARPGCAPSSPRVDQRLEQGAARSPDRLLRLDRRPELRLRATGERPSRSSTRSRIRTRPSARTRTRPRRPRPAVQGLAVAARPFHVSGFDALQNESGGDERHRGAAGVAPGRPRRPDRARVRVRLVPGPGADRDGDRLDHDHLPAGLGADHVHRHLARWFSS